MNKAHIVLLGDSILDNIKYVPDGKPVIEHLRQLIPGNWSATLLAVDGNTTVGVFAQSNGMPKDATHLVVSVGGNDAITYRPIFADSVMSVGEAMMRLSDIRLEFSQNYRRMLANVMRFKLPVAVCTIYDAIPGLSEVEKTALALFNDIILREAFTSRLPVIDLRLICNEEVDYSMISPIEPSHAGGLKVAKSIYSWVKGDGLQSSSVICGL